MPEIFQNLDSLNWGFDQVTPGVILSGVISGILVVLIVNRANSGLQWIRRVLLNTGEKWNSSLEQRVAELRESSEERLLQALSVNAKMLEVLFYLALLHFQVISWVTDFFAGVRPAVTWTERLMYYLLALIGGVSLVQGGVRQITLQRALRRNREQRSRNAALDSPEPLSGQGSTEL